MAAGKCLVNWDNSPTVWCVLDEDHPDFDHSQHLSARQARHQFALSADCMWFEVPDTREGWGKALELVEMAYCRENTLCCGGGGGRIWMETKKGERFSDTRIEQALEVGAEIMAVACPYCMSNFDDSVLTLGKEEGIKISDIAELAQQAL